MSFFSKITQGLRKTKEGVLKQVDNVAKNFRKVDEELLEELEEILILADLGFETTSFIIDELRDRAKEENIKDGNELKNTLKDILYNVLETEKSRELNLNTTPSLILVIGVNGVGKTTTIGKLSASFIKNRKSVTVAAGDTFRAAAIEQLGIWADRVGASFIAQSEGSDSAAVIYDAIMSAKAKEVDILICDTAGRLHNKVNLMNELAKVNRVIDRELTNSDKEVLLVIDATTGLNGLQQAKAFKESANISGIVVTKLDGSAKGGIVFAIAKELGIPIKYIGVGEAIDDLQPFDAKMFIDSLMGEE